MRMLSSLIIGALFCYSCEMESSNPSCNGIWESIGHNQILTITDSSTYEYFDITSMSCFPVRKRSFNEIVSSLSLENDTLTLVEGHYVTQFTRLNQLPARCENTLTETKKHDPIYNFDVFMQTVKENYAYLDLNKINFDELYKTQRAKLTATSTEAELYLLLEDTYEKLNDNHAFLNAPNEVYDAIDKMLEEEEEVSDDDIVELGDFPVADMVTKNHLMEDMTKDSWLVSWGKIKEDIGYVQLKAMWLFADLDIPDEMIDSLGYVDAYGITRVNMFAGHYMEKEVEGVNKIMQNVMEDLADTKSMVLDIRFNGGGQGVVSYSILEYFNPKRVQVASQKYRYGKIHTAANPVFLEAHKNAYTKPVYVLTSPQSGSAAETFSMATLSLPHVKRIGSSTEGAMSTTLDKKLPNGWDYCVSNEINTDMNGIFYENRGVPPDYKIDYPRGRQAFFRSVANDLEKDKRTILKAIDDMQSE